MPQTRGGDGDHLDVFVMGSASIASGMVVECRAIGMIELIDRGEKDDKILAIPVGDLGSQNIATLEDLSFDYKTIFETSLKEIGVQRSKTMVIKGYKAANIAMQELELAHKNFKKNRK